MSKSSHFPTLVNWGDKIYGILHLKNSLKIMNRAFRKYGASYGLRSSMLNEDMIFTKNPRLSDYVLRKNGRNYEKSYLQTETLGKYLGKGLLTNTGEDWLKQRRLIQPGFNAKKIESLKDEMLSIIEEFWNQIPDEKEIDIYPYFNQLAFSLVSKSVLGANLTEEESTYISKVVSEVQNVAMAESRHPLVAQWLKLSGKVRKSHESVNKVREIIRSVIHQKRQQTGTSNDLIEMLMDCTYEDTGEPMSEKQIIDEVLILMVAGHETTANALAFTFYLLGKHTHYIEQLIEAIKKEERLFETASLFQPSIFSNVINESLRMYPPAWVLDRVSLQNDSFEDYTWKKGTILVISLFEMNRDPQYWKEPLTFQPERFTEKEAQENYFIPFGAGQRFCIGEHFARMEMQLVLRSFFKNHTFRTTQKDLQLEALITLRPKKVLGIKIKK